MPPDPLAFTFTDLMDWIERCSGAVVQFHDLAGVTLQVPRLRMPAHWHYHHGPYCEAWKRAGGQPACAAAKERSLTLARRRRKPFCGTCPRGIWDWVVPVYFQDQPVGVFYLGSLRQESLPPVAGAPYAGPMPPTRTPTLQTQLKVYGEMLRGTMHLILETWTVAGNHWKQPRTPEFYHRAATAYIAANYHQRASLTDLADQLHLHANHLGRTIERACGVPFRSLLTAYRIEKAQVLLSDGNHSVTETAYACGFNDSNYFSTAFKRQTGQTPRAWCAAHRHTRRSRTPHTNRSTRDSEPPHEASPTPPRQSLLR